MHSRRAEVMAFAALLVAVAALVFALGSGFSLSAQSGTGESGQAEAQPQGAEAVAAIPATFNYQGILRQADGSLANGSYNLTLRIYAQVAGGTMLHQEPFNNVAVRDGVFNVVLGDAVPIQANVFADAPRYLGVTVGSDPEMIPRQRLHPVPWALQASTALQATTLVPGATVNGLNVGSYQQGDQYVRLATAGGNQYRSGIRLWVWQDNWGFTIENDERHSFNGLNILRHNGDAAGNRALFIERTSGDTTVFSDLKVKAIRDVGNAAGQVNRQTYDHSVRRYLVEAPDRGTIETDMRTVPVDETLLLDLCADEDGCSITLGMRDWNINELGKGHRATVTRRLSVGEVRPNGQRFVEVRDDNSNYGAVWDNNGQVNHLLNAWESCWLTDGEYTVGSSRGTDNVRGFGLLNSTGGYTTSTNMVCFLIIDD